MPLKSFSNWKKKLPWTGPGKNAPPPPCGVTHDGHQRNQQLSPGPSALVVLSNGTPKDDAAHDNVREITLVKNLAEEASPRADSGDQVAVTTNGEDAAGLVAAAGITVSSVVPELRKEGEVAVMVTTLPKENEVENVSTLAPQDLNHGVSTQFSLQSRDLWEEAWEKLSVETRSKLEKVSTGGTSSKLGQAKHFQELVDLAKQRQQICEEKKWKIRVGSHEIILREYVVSTVSCLQVIGDVAVQFAPPQASIPWSVLKGLMKVSLRGFSEHEKDYNLSSSPDTGTDDCVGQYADVCTPG
jgi:hypothetical protein